MKIGGRVRRGSRYGFLRWHCCPYPSPNPDARRKKALVLQALESPDNCPTRDMVSPSKVPGRREFSGGFQAALKNRGAQFLVQPIRQGLASMAPVEREFKRTDNFAHKPQWSIEREAIPPPSIAILGAWSGSRRRNGICQKTRRGDPRQSSRWSSEVRSKNSSR